MVRALGGSFQKDKSWVVDDPLMVSFIHECEKYAIEAGKPVDKYLSEAMTTLIDESSISVDTPLNFDLPDGLSLMHTQRSAIRWMIRHPSTLEGDPMGAGKTPVCAVFANHLRLRRVLIYCMATIKTNWRREWRKWNKMANEGETTVACASGSFWPGTDVVILNYDIADRFRTKYAYDYDMRRYHRRDKDGLFGPPRFAGDPYHYDKNGPLILERAGQIDEIEWDLIILDECHKIKGKSAIRTHAILGEREHGKVIVPPVVAPRRVAMSGSPMVNDKPAEIWPTANFLWPDSFPSFHVFGMRYCGGKRGTWGWRMDGHSNEVELNARLRLLGMIARPKSITHVDVPKKQRQIIEFEAHELEGLVAAEKSKLGFIDSDIQTLRAKVTAATVFDDEAGWRSAMKELKTKLDLSEDARKIARIPLARAKLPHVIKYVQDQLLERDKCVIFCWHKEIADALEAAFPGSAKIHSDVPTDERQPIIDRFQNDPSCRVIIGTIGALGTGTTLTAANLVVFAELHWVPGDMLQAEARCHRKTQTREVDIKYLIVEGSVDATMAERLITKMEVIERCTGPIQRMLQSLPVSYQETDADPVSSMSIDELEALTKHKKFGLSGSTRQKLRQIAQGRALGKLHQIDQIVAGRISNIESWNDFQAALAHKLVERYDDSKAA
jgi:SWI/SNF-related matrix-associated actin-dependent regulator 1 of chromatin subfamily A